MLQLLRSFENPLQPCSLAELSDYLDLSMGSIVTSLDHSPFRPIMAKSIVQPRALEIEQETGKTDLQLSPFYRREIFRLFDSQVSDEDLRLLHLLLKRQNGQYPTTTSAYYRLTHIYPVYNKYLLEVLRVITEARMSRNQRETKLQKLPILAKMHDKWSFSNPCEALEEGASMEEYPPDFQGSRNTTDEATAYDNGLARLYQAALHRKFPDGYRKVQGTGGRFSNFRSQDQPDENLTVDKKHKTEEEKLGENKTGADEVYQNIPVTNTTMQEEGETPRSEEIDKETEEAVEYGISNGDNKQTSAENEGRSKSETRSKPRARAGSTTKPLHFVKYLEITKRLEERLENARSSMRVIRAHCTDVEESLDRIAQILRDSETDIIGE
ncbi:hypothetical protein GGR57DRAFT_467811 [Xylariaceae sp. FL1272]|nr:hypothetical protein GGR57DRAFT_467811 [Xylariaceae sp. FL1272]